jgi:Protein of unknown function (DUF2934)
MIREEEQRMSSEAYLPDIAARAYLIWEREGCPEGKALDHWFEAEAELARDRAPSRTVAVTHANRARRPRSKKI